jgi:hypothetical protein
MTPLSSAQRTRAWQLRNPDKLPTKAAKRGYDREHNLRKKYRINHSQYEELLARQGGRCALCRSADPRAKYGRFHIDHCHVTDRIRGLLCAKCNMGLGSLGEDPRLLMRAIDYLDGTLSKDLSEVA